jgi:hypothetical protein
MKRRRSGKVVVSPSGAVGLTPIEGHPLPPGEEVLHEALLEGLEAGAVVALGGEVAVDGGEDSGDAVLFGERGK